MLGNVYYKNVQIYWQISKYPIKSHPANCVSCRTLIERNIKNNVNLKTGMTALCDGTKLNIFPRKFLTF